MHVSVTCTVCQRIKEKSELVKVFYIQRPAYRVSCRIQKETEKHTGRVKGKVKMVVRPVQASLSPICLHTPLFSGEGVAQPREPVLCFQRRMELLVFAILAFLTVCAKQGGRGAKVRNN